MLAATEGDNERQRKKSEQQDHIQHFFHKTRKCLEVSRCRRAKQPQRIVQKKVFCTCKVVFLLIRPTVFWLFSLPSLLSITPVYILFQ